MSTSTRAGRPALADPRAARAGVGPRARWSPRRIKEAAWAAAFLAPAVLTIATTRIAPSVDAFVDSLHRGFPGGLRAPVFDGLGQYQALLSTDAFRETVARTVVFNVIINPLQVALALLVAVLMTRRIALRGVWRMLLFVPATIPLVGPWIGRNIQHIRDWALVAAVIIGGATVTYGIGVHDGKVSVQAKWDKAEQAAVKRGADARAGAERSVGKSPATPGLRDQFNRDN